MTQQALIKTTSISALLLAALCFGSCRTVGFLEPVPDMRELSEARERQRRIHGDSEFADQAAEVFASEGWRSKSTPSDGPARKLNQESLVAVHKPRDPRFPDALRPAGWIKIAFAEDSSLQRMTYYDVDWRVLAYLNADNELSVYVGDELKKRGRADMVDAARQVFGAEAWFGIDNLRYEESTMLALMPAWSSQSSEARGIALERVPRVIAISNMDETQLALFLHALSADVFRAREEEKQQALQLERAGALGDFDRHIGEIPEKSGSKP